MASSALPFVEALALSVAVLELGHRTRVKLRSRPSEAIPLLGFLAILLLGERAGAAEVGIAKACLLTWAGHALVATLWPGIATGLAVDIAAALALVVGGVTISFVRGPSGLMYLPWAQSAAATILWVVGLSRLLRLAAVLPGLLEGLLAQQAYLCLASLYVQNQAGGPVYGAVLAFAGTTTGLWFYTYRKPPAAPSPAVAAAWCTGAAAISLAATSKTLVIATALLPIAVLALPVVFFTGVILASYFAPRIGPRVWTPRPMRLDPAELVTLVLTFCLLGNLTALIYALSGDPFLLAGPGILAAALVLRLAGHLIEGPAPRATAMKTADRVEVLGLPFFARREGICRLIDQWIARRVGRIIVTPDSLSVHRATSDAAFRRILLSADVLVPDGAGVVWAAALLHGAPVLDQIPGVELVGDILASAAAHAAPVYFLGARPGIAERAAAQARLRYPRLIVCGVHHGYYDAVDESRVVADVEARSPAIVLVALGVPRQELWMAAHRQRLPDCLLIGVGGTLDVLSGEKQRAPRAFQRWGLEWLYRLICEPSRLQKMLHLPLFVIEVLKTKIMGDFDAVCHKP